jgi:hypothetical protein
MKKVTHIVLFPLIALIFVTCKKQELAPSTVENQPIFSFYGNMGGNILNVQAGVNNYYMFSSDSLIKDSSQGGYVVNSFTGTLRNTSTANNSIQITINDDSPVSSNNPSDISNSIINGNSYYYNTPNGTRIWDSVYFTPKLYLGKSSSFSYKFGDGTTATATSVAPIGHLYKKLQDYHTQMHVTFDSGTPDTMTISNFLQLTSQSTAPLEVNSVRTFLIADYSYKHEVSFWAYVSGGTSPYTYQWSFDTIQQFTSGSAINTIHTFSTEPADSFLVTLKVTDHTKKDTAYFQYYYTDTLSSNNSAAYSMAVHPVANPYGLSTVTVNYTDAQGHQYTSKNSSQSRNSTFQVTSVSNYQNNKDNNPTKMLKVSFNCMLYNAALHDSITATNCTAVIAVAYH